jgi:hypothetical protein
MRGSRCDLQRAGSFTELFCSSLQKAYPAIDKTFEFVEKFTAASGIIFTYNNKLVLDNPRSFIGTEKLLKNLSKSKERWTLGFKPEELSGL